jgi:hypothetical protein
MFSPVETRYSNPPWATLLQRKLVENPTIRNRFINQIADLLNTNFKSDRVINVINTLANHIASEITRHRQKWNLSGESLTKMTTFAQQRPAYLRTHVRNYFNCGLEGTLKIDATAGGSVRLNTFLLQLADLPFSGIYFLDNPIHLKAIPATGYKFDGWSGSVTSNDPCLTLSVSRSTNLCASFSVDGSAAKEIVINEINYNSADDFDSGDWVELFNNSDRTINISGWYFSDSEENHKFIFPNETILAPNDYLVIVDNDSAFKACFPDVKNFVGETGFGLSGSGEFMKLVNDEEQIIDSLTYDDNLPWPVEADGAGATLELIDPASDNSKGENWQASVAHGTPGEQNSQVTGIAENKLNSIPDAFSLSQNYPNSFNPTTTIKYSLPRDGHVSLKVYDLLGKEVATLFEGMRQAGNYVVSFDGSGLSTGVYFYQMKSENFIETKKFVLIQ